MTALRFALAAVLLAAIGLVPQFLSRSLPDIAFLLYTAGKLLDGGRLYVDVLEVNPPLIVWLNVPVVLISRLAGMSDLLVYRIAVTGLLAASVAGCGWVLGRSPEGESIRARRILLLSIVVALFILPRLDWGEREHLTLALTLPYVLLAAVRLDGGRVPALPAAGIGLAAAVGIAIKPHFVLVWAVREGLTAMRTRSRLTLEGLVILIGGAAYAGAAALFVPEYFSLVRSLGGAYHVYLHNSLPVTALLGDGAAMALGALLLAAALWRRTAGNLRIMLLGTTAAFYLAAVLQLKGWRYHFYPALALGWLLVAVLAMRVRTPARTCMEGAFAAIVRATAGTVAVAAVLGCLLQAARPLDPRYDADPSIGLLLPVVSEYARGRDLIVLSPNMASGFPLTSYAGARWPQRLSNAWPLVAAYDSALRDTAKFRYRPPNGMTELERFTLRTVTDDLLAADAPVMLVLRRGPDAPGWGMRRLELLEFFSRDARFARLLSGYVPAGTVGQYDLYRRGDVLPRPIAPARALRGDPVPPGAIRVAPDSMLLAGLFAAALVLAYLRERKRTSRDLSGT